MTYSFHADLGGQPGHGPVTPEAEGEFWHAAFEPKAMALTIAMGATGAWNIDQSRSARETLPGYAQLSYYRIWLAGIQRLMALRGLLGDDEVAASRMLHPPLPLPRKLLAAAVPAVLAKGSPTNRPAPGPARFAVGDVVRTRAGHVDHHSRLPGYAQGKRGIVAALHGAHVFPDTNAQGLGEQPQWLYTVVFDGATLWGADAQPGLQVSVDAWDSYLQPDDGDRG
ncbi:MAG: nitrile hydratase subunit beta [Aquabacterium sp.]|nr:nitrile hydratase subunit beta [Aquabacterium sp.]